MKRMHTLFGFVLAPLLLGCSTNSASAWKDSDKAIISRVLGDWTIPYYHLGDVYSLSFTEQPENTINSVLIKSSLTPNDFNIRYYIRAVEAEGYTGIKSYDELIVFIGSGQESSAIFLAGVFSPEIKSEFDATVASALALAVAMGVIPPGSIIVDDYFPIDSINVGDAFIYVAAFGGV